MHPFARAYNYVRDKAGKAWKRAISPIYKSVNEPHYTYNKIGKLKVHETKDIQMMRDVLQDEENFPAPRFVKKTLKKLIGHALGNDEGASWQKMHDVMMENFTPANIRKNVTPLVIEECDALIDKWEKKGDQLIDIEHEILEATGSIIIRNIMGDSLSKEDAHTVIDTIRETFKKLESPTRLGRMLRAIGLPYDHPGFVFGIALRALGINDEYAANPPKELGEGAKVADDILYKAIAERKKLTVQPKDLLGILLESTTHENIPLTDKEIRDQILMMIVAGHETTAVSLTFAMDEILRKPDIQAKLREEFNTVAKVDPKNTSDVNKMPYTRNAFKEAIRMHPAIRTTSREATQDMTVAGVKIEKNDLVKLNIQGLQMREDLWKDPKNYRPERFEEADVPSKAYVPFGLGPRMCIGMSMAMNEGVVFLSRIFNRLDLEAKQHLEGEKYFFTMHPKGNLLVKAKPRPPQP